MIFVIKFPWKPYWIFKNSIKLIKKHLYFKNEFYIEILIYFKTDVLYFIQFLHNLSNNFFKNLILIRCKKIEANYLYVYPKKKI